MSIVNTALNEYIENNVFDEMKNINMFQLMIEAEGNDEKEIKLKDNLYNYHLKRLANKFSKVADNIFCTHSKDNLTHYLTFSHVKNA